MMLQAALLPGLLSAVQGTNPSFLDIDASDANRGLVRASDVTAKEIATANFYRLHDKLSKASLARSGAEAAAAIEEAAEMVVQSGVKIDQITRATLQTLRGTLVNTTEGMIRQAHANDQKLLDDHADFLHDCAEAKVKGLEGDDFVLNATNHARHMHRECQKDLNELEGFVNYTCKSLDEFRTKLRPPLCALPTGDQWRDIMDEFFINLDAWATENEETWDSLEEECTGSGHEDHARTKLECHRYQGEFEKHFCTYRLSVINTCYEYRECFDRSLREFAMTNETVSKNEHGRKVDWRATGKLKCYIDVILSEKESHEREQMTRDCKAETRDTSCLDIKYPELPEQEACDTSHIHPHPCTQEFMMTEYAGMLNAECMECTALPPYLQDFADSMLPGANSSLPGEYPVDE